MNDRLTFKHVIGVAGFILGMYIFGLGLCQFLVSIVGQK
jgi:hypothetical protein